MEKTTYYVSVGSGDILQDPKAASFEFEIRATPEELNELEELFEERAEASYGTARRAVIPYVEYHHDKENDAYDRSMRDIYLLLHRLGTPETRRHIESMNILPE